MPSHSGESPRILYPIEEAAHLLGIGRSSAFQLVRSGELRPVRIGRRLLIPHEAIEMYAQSLMALEHEATDDD